MGAQWIALPELQQNSGSNMRSPLARLEVPAPSSRARNLLDSHVKTYDTRDRSQFKTLGTKMFRMFDIKASSKAVLSHVRMFATWRIKTFGRSNHPEVSSKNQ